MKRVQAIPGGWYGSALPFGEYACLKSGQAIVTHQGDLPLDGGDDPLFIDITTVGGFKVAGQSHNARGTLEWDGTWSIVGPSFGVNPQLYLPDGRLQIAVGSHQGFRFVGDDGVPRTGDDTFSDPVNQLNEWHEHLGWRVGFSGESLQMIHLATRRRYLIARGRLGANSVKFNVIGTAFAVFYHHEEERTSYAVWFDEADIPTAFEETAGPVEPDGPDDPEPEPDPPPTCTITHFPTVIEFGDLATVTAQLSGGPADRLIWLYRPEQDTTWRVGAVQAPPATTHGYLFDRPGRYAIAIRAEGPGGFDQTTASRIIEVTAAMPDPDPDIVKVAFGPTPAAPGMLQLFTEDETWTEARRHTSVFHVHLGQIFSFDNVGPNTYEHLVEAHAFEKLKTWNVLVELGSDRGADEIVDAADKILSAGGTLDFVAHDRAFHELSADQVADLIKGTRTRVPSLRAFGLYAAFPFKTVEQIRSRLVELDARGARPDFLRLDVDPGQYQTLTPAAFRQFRDMCDDRRIALQYVVNAPDNLTDAEYVAKAKAKFAYTQPLGRWDGLIVESWARRGDLFVLPKAGPESDPSSQAALLLHVVNHL